MRGGKNIKKGKREGRENVLLFKSHCRRDVASRLFIELSVRHIEKTLTNFSAVDLGMKSEKGDGDDGRSFSGSRIGSWMNAIWLQPYVRARSVDEIAR
jgi:hypothetical protein